MHSDHLLLTTLGSGRNLSDADARGVGGEDGVLGGRLGEVTEEGGLEGGVLGDSLDHKVNVGEIGHVLGCLDARSGLLGLSLGQAALGDILLQQRVYLVANKEGC